MFVKVVTACLVVYLAAGRQADVVQGKGNVITGNGGNVVIGDSNEVQTVDPTTVTDFYKPAMDDIQNRFNTKFSDNLGNILKDNPLAQTTVLSVQKNPITVPSTPMPHFFPDVPHVPTHDTILGIPLGNNHQDGHPTKLHDKTNETCQQPPPKTPQQPSQVSNQSSVVTTPISAESTQNSLQGESTNTKAKTSLILLVSSAMLLISLLMI
jgi:hypothetical protein